MIRQLVSIAAILLLALPSAASTWIVDDGGGPGVDFTDIGSAIAAAHPGDVIRVRPGSYAGFTLAIGVEILADAGANVVNPPFDVNITAVPAGQRATVSGLSILASHVTNCTGRVFLEHVTGDPLFGGPPVVIAGSSDVRLRACAVSVDASSSRVEITDSALLGHEGAWGCEEQFCSGPQFDGGPGTPGIVAQNGAEVHIGASSIEGGHGGFGGGFDFHCPNGNGGDGGPAIQALTGANVLVTGTGTEAVRGGFGAPPGNDAVCFPDGQFGHTGAAIDASGGTVLYSGVVVQGTILGSAQSVVPADPCLVVAGSGIPGTQITYTVHGQPGDEVRLRLGRQMTIEDLPFVYEDRLVVPLRGFALGQMPASGSVSFSIVVPGTLPPNFVLVAQASTVTPGTGESRLTQSAPVAIR
jgi:hypothetical protein